MNLSWRTIQRNGFSLHTVINFDLICLSIFIFFNIRFTQIKNVFYNIPLQLRAVYRGFGWRACYWPTCSTTLCSAPHACSKCHTFTCPLKSGPRGSPMFSRLEGCPGKITLWSREFFGEISCPLLIEFLLRFQDKLKKLMCVCVFFNT